MSNRIIRSFSSLKRAIVPLLLTTTILFSLWVNIHSLYTFPSPNSWIYWDGDETQAMAESHSQVTTLLYAYPNAVGSIFQHGSGILKGSVWITSLIYGGAAYLIAANPVGVGRSISFILACLLLAAVYRILRKQNTSVAITLTAILAFSTTDGFLIMSHSARPDMLIALADLFIIATLIRFRNSIDSNDRRTGLTLGLLIMGGLLVSIHVWIDCGLTMIFLLWRKGMMKRWRIWMFAALIVIIGFCIVSFLYYYKTGRFDFFGPFGYLPPPLQHFFSPGAQRGNLLYRWFILTEWSPAYIIVGIFLLIGVLFLRFKGKHVERIVGSWIAATFLLLLSLIYLEAILPRYYIYVLPSLTVSLALVAQSISNSINHRVLQRSFSAVIFLVIIFFAFRFSTGVVERSKFADKIAAENRDALSSAIGAMKLDHSERKRVVAVNPALYILSTSSDIFPIAPLFMTAPDSAWSADTAALFHKADYIVTINSQRVVGYGGSDRSFSPLIYGKWKLLMERTGKLTDVGRTYSMDGMWGDDTLRLYRIIK